MPDLDKMARIHLAATPTSLDLPGVGALATVAVTVRALEASPGPTLPPDFDAGDLASRIGRAEISPDEAARSLALLRAAVPKPAPPLEPLTAHLQHLADPLHF